MDSQYIR